MAPAALAADALNARLERPLRRLAAILPGPAATARAALSAGSRPIAGSRWPAVAWRASALNDDGFPFEFAWSSRDRSIRWTGEVAGPEVPAGERPTRALELVARLGAAPVPHVELVEPKARLRFGAWLGGRHRERGSSYKLYVEQPLCPPNPEDEAALAEFERIHAHRIGWRMVGCDLEDGSREYYGRLSQLTANDMALALQWVGLSGWTAEVQESIARLRGGDGREFPLGRTAGISLSLRDGAPVALSWFAGPHAFRRPKRNSAQALVEACEAMGRDAGLLAALVRDPAAPLGRIGMTGLGVNERATWLQCGWRPETTGD